MKESVKKITSTELKNIITEAVKTILSETQYYKDGNIGNATDEKEHEAWLQKKAAARKAYFDNLKKRQPAKEKSQAIDYKEYKHGDHPVMVKEGVEDPDSNYTHYAVNKKTGKIVNGWDYSDVDPNDLRRFKKDYFSVDLEDMELDPKLYKIVGRQYLLRSGIDTQDWGNWANV